MKKEVQFRGGFKKTLKEYKLLQTGVVKLSFGFC